MYSPEIATWVNPNIEYLFGSEIYEYDIRAAGLSISKAYHLLPEETLRRWESLDKDRRNILLGLERRDNKQYSKDLSAKFAEVRKFFINFNDLSDQDIITVKNDAIFTIGRQSSLVFGDVEFRTKNQYRDYIRLNGIEILIGERTDVKGMGVTAVNSHRLYLLSFLESIAQKIEARDKMAIRNCIRFIDRFKTGELEDQYYLEFNSRSRQKDPLQVYTKFLIPILEIAMRECK